MISVSRRPSPHGHKGRASNSLPSDHPFSIDIFMSLHTLTESKLKHGQPDDRGKGQLGGVVWNTKVNVLQYLCFDDANEWISYHLYYWQSFVFLHTLSLSQYRISGICFCFHNSLIIHSSFNFSLTTPPRSSATSEWPTANGNEPDGDEIEK